MATHKKPTPEELKKIQEEAIAAGNNPPTPEPEPSEPVPSEPIPSEPVPGEPVPSEPIPSEPVPSEPVPEPESQAEPSKEIYKKKFSESSKEAQKIAAKNRVLNQAITDTDEIPEPTEEELQTEFKDWELMSEVERTLARETLISRRWRARIKEAQDQAKKIEKWNESVDGFIGDPKVLIATPALEGRQEEFAEFAKQESNNSVPFNILVGAFLYDQSTKGKKNKGAMFPTGSGGPNEKPTPKTDMLTVEEGRKLRETDYDKWKEMLKAGKIAKE